MTLAASRLTAASRTRLTSSQTKNCNAEPQMPPAGRPVAGRLWAGGLRGEPERLSPQRSGIELFFWLDYGLSFSTTISVATRAILGPVNFTVTLVLVWFASPAIPVCAPVTLVSSL